MQSVFQLFKSKHQIGILGGIFVFLFVILFTNLEPGKPEVTFTLAVALLMAIWWVTEAVPLAITSLLPVILFPLLGIMNGKEVSSTYFNHVIFLFIGGFIVAIAMQKWDLHKRIALKILMYTGVSPARILLGFMVANSLFVNVDIKYCYYNDDGTYSVIYHSKAGREYWGKSNGKICYWSIIGRSL